MTVADIDLRICANCVYWVPDKYNLHEACEKTGIPCGELHSCNKHKYYKTVWVPRDGGEVKEIEV